MNVFAVPVTTTRPALTESGRRRGLLRHHPHHLGPQAQKIPHADDGADPRTHPHRHVDSVELAGGAKRFAGVGRDA
jgi:hypothetical protein